MTSFRKFCRVVYFLAALLSVGAIACDWFGFEPVATVVRTCKTQTWFVYLVLALLALFAVGLVAGLVRTIAARNKSSYQETPNEYGSVCISKAALECAVEDIVLRHPELHYEKAKVTIVNGKHPAVQIVIRVATRGLISLAAAAPILQREVKESVEKLTGNQVKSVTVDVRENKDPNDLMSESEQKALEGRLATEQGFTPLMPPKQTGVAGKSSATAKADASSPAAETATTSVSNKMKSAEKDDKQATEQVKQPAPDVKQSTTSAKQPVADVKQSMTSAKQPVAAVKQPDATDKSAAESTKQSLSATPKNSKAIIATPSKDATTGEQTVAKPATVTADKVNDKPAADAAVKDSADKPIAAETAQAADAKAAAAKEIENTSKDTSDEDEPEGKKRFFAKRHSRKEKEPAEASESEEKDA